MVTAIAICSGADQSMLMLPEGSKAVQSATLEAASSTTRGRAAGCSVGWPLPGSAKSPRAARCVPRRGRSRAGALRRGAL
eukprot:scaffold119912_cov66-Phaeocystis_antarctica.AAC.2